MHPSWTPIFAAPPPPSKKKSSCITNDYGTSFYYSGFPKETPELKFQLRFLFHSATVCKSLTRMRDDLTLMSTWHGVMVDEEKFIWWKIGTTTLKNGYEIFTQRSSAFGTGWSTNLTRDLFIYERTFINEPFI